MYGYEESYIDETECEPVFFNRRPKQKQIVWTTGQGEMIPITDMEDSHVQNTINYLTRKSFEWEHAQIKAKEHGVELGTMIINKKLITDWLEIFYAEVKRRQEQL